MSSESNAVCASLCNHWGIGDGCSVQGYVRCERGQCPLDTSYRLGYPLEALRVGGGKAACHETIMNDHSFY